MWEIIAANKRKSMALFAAMGACLLALGYFIGVALYGDGGGMGGLFIALGIWGFLSVISVFAGSSIILASSRAREIKREHHPQLYNVVEEMKIAAGLPAMPKIYIIEDPAPNAFATGIKPENSAIAVTSGLLAKLNRDELQGVIAHEMSHIMNRDVQFMTIAGIMLGSIVLLSEVFLRSLWFGGGRRSRVSSKGGGGQAQLVIIAVAIAVAILAPIFARLFYFAISRKREYLADASGVRLTRYPEGLASALEKIAFTPKRMTSANKVTAPMYIVNPFQGPGASLSGLSSTHPPIEERIRILRAMGGGAGYLNYQRAFSKVRGKPAIIIPRSGLKEDEKIEVRAPAVSKEEAAGGKASARDAIDVLRAASGYAFLVCACGLRMKIPPDFDKPSVVCPRCGRENAVPLAVLGGVEAALKAAGVGKRAAAATEREPLVYERSGKGWESFKCSCGRIMQISPAFSAGVMKCPDCGRKTKVIDKT